MIRRKGSIACNGQHCKMDGKPDSTAELINIPPSTNRFCSVAVKSIPSKANGIMHHDGGIDRCCHAMDLDMLGTT